MSVSDRPRILMISERNLARKPPRLCFYEFEDVVCQVDHVELVAPQARPRDPSGLFRIVSRGAEKVMGLEVKYTSKVPMIHITRDYDLFILIVPGWTGRFELLDRVKGWRDHCATTVCWLYEVWTSWVNHLRQHTDPGILRQFDHVIVGLKGTVPALSDYLGKPCAFIPGGIDALRFCPYPDPPERVIDVYNMGRRSPGTHDALLAWAAQSGRFYLYDTVTALEAKDIVQHRLQLAELTKRTRFFIANKARIDNPDVTAGQDEPGLRFFEGAAAGAVMIGEPPMNSDAYNELFDWPDAVISVPFGSQDIPDVMAGLDRDPERIARIRTNNVVNSLTRFDWAYSWKQLLERIGLPLSERMRLRIKTLEQLAERASLEATAA